MTTIKFRYVSINFYMYTVIKFKYMLLVCKHEEKIRIYVFKL